MWSIIKFSYDYLYNYKPLEQPTRKKLIIMFSPDIYYPNPIMKTFIRFITTNFDVFIHNTNNESLNTNISNLFGKNIPIIYNLHQAINSIDYKHTIILSPEHIHNNACNCSIESPGDQTHKLQDNTIVHPHILPANYFQLLTEYLTILTKIPDVRQELKNNTFQTWIAHTTTQGA